MFAPRKCFNTETYLAAQTEEILSRMVGTPRNGLTYIEFGGKAYDDQHATRVLPGYDPNTKLRLLRNLSSSFEILLVVSARDLLKPRIRGDSQLFYDMETIRVASELGAAGLNVTHGVITMCQKKNEPWAAEKLALFETLAKRELGMVFHRHGYISDYPNPSVLDKKSPFATCPKLTVGDRNILVLSPGGGSGKFSVCLSQLFHDFTAGRNSAYLKFETFPVFRLSPYHEVNLAFLAATADLGNVLLSESKGGLTTYDKDMQNFRLLRLLIKKLCPNQTTNPMSHYRYPSDMGVNRLLNGFVYEPGIREAASREITRRISRYRDEIARGIEYPATLTHLQSILPEFRQAMAFS